MKGRCWSEEEDELLAAVVLKSVRDGGNQLDAFEEVSRKIGRTPGACGFRWNAVVRKKKADSFYRAKKQRVANHLKKKRESSFTLKEIIQQLRDFERQYQMDQIELKQLQERLNERKYQLKRITEENLQLNKEWEEYNDFQHEIKNRYANLLKMLQSVRKLAEDGEPIDKWDIRSGEIDDRSGVDTEKGANS
ncbi:hypothetical protein GXN76_12715 [Kroppenstedtia pulmonis]|uniref:Uncharacterized protein n=1 Tax=Kroppenstedtia pulmonis TaxID=1380685 RepID=A0A7D4BGQ9_9BACL|nr:hypothetical protein [Kroppenstedtia pulmonis]QKG85252.1 hypothetical protein GXN76_12715 [Kroppenstedtia pulmonis]